MSLRYRLLTAMSTEQGMDYTPTHQRFAIMKTMDVDPAVSMAADHTSAEVVEVTTTEVSASITAREAMTMEATATDTAATVDTAMVAMEMETTDDVTMER